MPVERLVPDAAPEPLDQLYRDLVVPSGRDRPHVYLGMVASVDGATSVAGRTAGLGGEADALAYSRLRETCDVILVGAGTAREEDYGPPRARAGGVERRRARGLSPRPAMAVVTASGRLDPGARLFADPAWRPAVVVPRQACGGPVEAVADRADILVSGEESIDVDAMLAAFAARRWMRVLCEGGPTLNGVLLAAGAVDELFVTITPTLVGGRGTGIVGEDPGGRHDLQLMELRHHAGELVARYRVR